MRLLVTGAGGLIGSNFAAAAAQQSWSVLGTWRRSPVSVRGARTAPLDVTDRHACVALAEELEPDVIVHAAGESSLGLLEREPRLAEQQLLGTENTLAAARAVRARYVLVSCDHVFSGRRASGECWEEGDPTEPINALGRSLQACERLAENFRGDWLITRPADVYGVNLANPLAAHPNGNGTAHGGPRSSARAHHVWTHSGPPLRWVAWLRSGRVLPAPRGIRRSPTYAWDYAQRLCELIAQEGEGLFHTAGPTILGRLAHLRLLARAFGCNLELVREGSPAAFLHACGEWSPSGLGSPSGSGSPTSSGSPSSSAPASALPALPANTALCDHKASFLLGRPAVDPFTGHRLMRRQLDQLLGSVKGALEGEQDDGLQRSGAAGGPQPRSGAAGGLQPRSTGAAGGLAPVAASGEQPPTEPVEPL